MKKIAILILFTMMIPVFVSAQTVQSLGNIDTLAQELQTGSFDMESLGDLFDTNTNLPVGIPEAISVGISPKYPRPNQNVTVTLKSSTLNLDKAQISWFVNGLLINKQIGEKQFNFVTGDLGKNSRVRVVVEKIEGGIYDDEFLVKTSEVDMYYEAQTYAPPFFIGKPQFTFQSAVKVFATPRGIGSNGQIIPLEDYTYKWSINDRVIQTASGYAKNVFNYGDSIFSETAKISVVVSSRDGSINSSGSITLKPTSPKVLIYENNPIFGTIFSSAINGFRDLNRPEISFVVVPFSFDKNISALQYTWRMNGDKIPVTENSDSITFRQESEVTGRSNISVEVSNEPKILQSASGVFGLIYNKESGKQFNF